MSLEFVTADDVAQSNLLCLDYLYKSPDPSPPGLLEAKVSAKRETQQRIGQEKNKKKESKKTKSKDKFVSVNRWYGQLDVLVL